MVYNPIFSGGNSSGADPIAEEMEDAQDSNQGFLGEWEDREQTVDENNENAIEESLEETSEEAQEAVREGEMEEPDSLEDAYDGPTEPDSGNLFEGIGESAGDFFGGFNDSFNDSQDSSSSDSSTGQEQEQEQENWKSVIVSYPRDLAGGLHSEPVDYTLTADKVKEGDDLETGLAATIDPFNSPDKIENNTAYGTIASPGSKDIYQVKGKVEFTQSSPDERLTINIQGEGSYQYDEEDGGLKGLPGWLTKTNMVYGAGLIVAVGYAVRSFTDLLGGSK